MQVPKPKHSRTHTQLDLSTTATPSFNRPEPNPNLRPRHQRTTLDPSFVFFRSLQPAGPRSRVSAAMANLLPGSVAGSTMGGGMKQADVGKNTATYQQYFKEDDSSKRKANYADVVNKYYDLATSFYEYGW